MHKRRYASRLAFAVLAVFGALNSPDRTTAQQVSPSPTRLALEVTYYPGRKPSYQQVSSSTEGSWVWYGLFARIEGSSATGGGSPIKAIHIACRREADAVRVIISVLSGENAPDYKQQIAEYTLRESEKITVEELKQFGIQPFEIKLIRISPNSSPAPPVIFEDIHSLTLVSVQSKDSTIPSYTISLLNNSTRSVVALGVDVVADGRTETTGLPRGKDGKPLMEPGATYELVVQVPLRARQVAGGYEPAAMSGHEIHIKAVLFDDGTSEGDPATATRARGFRESDKRLLLKLVPLLDEALKAPSENIRDDLNTLARAVTSLTRDNESNNSAKPNVRLDADKSQAEAHAAGAEVFSPPIIAELLTAIHRLEQKESLNENEYRAWLTVTKERYDNWLARL